MNKKDFVALVKKDCRHHNIEFFVPKTQKIWELGCYLTGYFDGFKLAVAGGISEKRFMQTLAHEYCHMQQYLDKAPVWTNAIKSKFADWIVKKRGVSLSGESLNKAYLADALVELDCERRTLDMIDALDLPLDHDEYAKSANAYVWSFAWQRDKRAWFKRAPHRIPQICAKLPTELITNKQLEPPGYVMDLMNKYLKVE